MRQRVDVAVVGGGISGLAAAWEAHRRGAEVVVLERSERVGGTLVTSQLGDRQVDEAADAFLARVPDAVELCRELGIEGELVSPATGSAFVWSDGELRRLPAEQLLGVPTDLDAVAASGLLSSAGVERARADLTLSDDRPAGDETIGELVRRRLGDEVLDRLVGPLIGGIWAGDPDALSLQTAAPALAVARDRDPSLLRGAAAVRTDALAAGASGGVRQARTSEPTGESGSSGGIQPRPAGAASGGNGPDGEARPRAGAEPTDRAQPRATGAASGGTGPGGDAGGRPVFLAPRSGMQRLSDALGEALGDRVRRSCPVTAIEPDGSGWRLQPVGVEADAVVLALPAPALAPLLADLAPAQASRLAAIDHASVTLVGLVVPRDGVDCTLDGSGLLVPPGDGRWLTACSWTSSKWPHLADDGSSVVLRASAGRAGDDRAATAPDDALVDALLADLRDVMGLRAAPSAVRVSRWPRSFPQPRPGHLDAVIDMETELARLAPGLAATGAWARGIGIPACIRGGRAATARALARS